MRKIAAIAVSLAVIGVSAPSFAQYGGYGYDGRRGGGYDDYEGGPRGGYGRARGSFWGSCRDVDQDGPYLRALCRTRDGDWVPSRLDLRRCDGGSVSNQNGRLRC